MSKNFVQEGDTITVTAGGTVASGDGVLTGTLFGVAQYNATSGQDVEVDVTGVYDLPKASAAVIAQGGAAYWDNTAKNVTGTATSNTRIGAVVTAVTSGGLVARVRLDPVSK